MLAANRLGDRKITTSTSDTKEEVAIKFKPIINTSPDTPAAAFMPAIAVAKNSQLSEN